MLNTKDYFPAKSEIQELTIIEGRHDVVLPYFLSRVDTFMSQVMPALGHDPSGSLVGCGRGITDTDADGDRKIAILYSWYGTNERDSEMGEMFMRNTLHHLFGI